MNKKPLTQTFSTLILMIFLIVGTFGVMAMSNHHHEPSCLFMSGEQAICSMSALDHITTWQNTLIVTLPILFVYSLLAVIVLFIWKYYSPPDLFVRRLLSSRTRYPVSIPLYQELFSSGILNPKAP